MSALALSVVIAIGLGAADAYAGKARRPEAVPGELVVKVKPSRSLRMTGLGIQAESMNVFRTDSSFYKVRLKAGTSVRSAIETLSRNPDVEYAEPNYVYRALESGIPNDPQFFDLWGMSNRGQVDSAGSVGVPGLDINVAPVWAAGMTGSRKIVVAVIDTGIEWEHPDLIDNLFTNAAESGANANNGIDDDGNGFIDDTHGWNFADHTRNSNDDQGHGTHCSGTIGGSGNNGIGVAGVNWEVTLLPVKFLSAQGGGTTEGAIEAVNYATKMGVNVMSNSWGGGGQSQALREAIEKTRDAGILFVAAAGNSSLDNDTSPTYPASYPVENILSVAAVDNQGRLASFSNYGKKTVHVAAPGVNILSSYLGKTYRAASGTSMACPHVSGVAALVLAANPGMTASELKERLIQTSQPLASVKRKVISRGIVSAANAINNVVTPPVDPDPSLWVDLPYAVESTHPYDKNSNQTFKVEVPGAKFIRVIFDRIDTESRYDTVSVENNSGESVDSFTGSRRDVTSEAVLGDVAIIRLKSDDTINLWGFSVTKIQVIR